MFTLPPKLFGCMAFVHIYDHHHSKLDLKATKCLFLGYPPTQTGYKCYSPITRKFYVNLDVTFFEKQPFTPKIPFWGRKIYKNGIFGFKKNYLIGLNQVFLSINLYLSHLSHLSLLSLYALHPHPLIHNMQEKLSYMFT